MTNENSNPDREEKEASEPTPLVAEIRILADGSQQNSCKEKVPQVDYLKLAEMKQRDFKDRRDLEWKLSLSLWAAVAALLYAVGRSEGLLAAVSELLSGSAFPWAVLALVVVWVLHACVISAIQDSHHDIRSLYWYYIEMYESQSHESSRPIRFRHVLRADGTFKHVGKLSWWHPGRLFPFVYYIFREDLTCKWNRKTCFWYLYHVVITGLVLLAGFLFLLGAKSKKETLTSKEVDVSFRVLSRSEDDKLVWVVPCSDDDRPR